MDKLLIVDDDQTFRDILAITFRCSSYKLFFAENGEMALEIANHEHPDIFILDVKMPGIDGLEVCRRIRSDPRLENAVVIMLSSLSAESDQKKGMDSGADYYMVKPFHSIELVELVEALHEKRKANMNLGHS